MISTAGLAAGLGPAAWNAILNAVHAPGFFTDAPIPVFPVSRQDTGSGVFAWQPPRCCSASDRWPA
ncbi:hypothetical protein [Amycolatopsis rifamycinica]|uniref:hypothetical protein n=1 Tax=Amycolatopsis rifamycinica TaxID=287986 RepID=UPI00068A4137|nr:hypothetical protein [Amycolatopsis rifamycinica]